MSRIRIDTEATKELRAAIERYRAFTTHDFDENTGYRLDCGQHDVYAIENRIHCFGDGRQRIVPISQLRRPDNPELDAEYRDADTIWKSPA